jgi:hypothetical protein
VDQLDRRRAVAVIRHFLRVPEENHIDGVIPNGQPPTFRGSNLEIQSYRGREFILAGPAETGKTYAAIWLIDTLLRETPRAQAVLARKLQVSLWGTVLMTYQRIQQLRESLGEKSSSPYGGQKPEWYEYSNGSRLWIGGMDNPNKMLSGERDFIYINQAEELKLEDWEILLTRCTGRGAVTKTPMIFGDCNPGAEDHWIMKRETLKVFHSRHEDNPTLYDDDGKLTEQGHRTMQSLDSLTGVRKARLRDGKWVGAEGLYFEEWDEDLHTCDPLPDVPGDWPVWGAMDYGYSHPTAFGVFTQDNDGNIIMLGEHVQHKWLIPQHCKAIHRLIARLGLTGRVKRIVAGHDCFQQRGDREAKTIADQYAAAIDPDTGDAIGIRLEKANVDRVTGAKEIQERLGNQEIQIAPRLRIVNTCKKTISAMTRMVCDPHDPEDVLKVDADVNGEGGDDPYDMIRYAVMAKKGRTLAWA